MGPKSASTMSLSFTKRPLFGRFNTNYLTFITHLKSIQSYICFSSCCLITYLDLWQYQIRFQLIDWHPAADKSHDNMAMWTDGICQANCGSYLGRRKIIERKRHQNDFTLHHRTVSHRKACRYPLWDLSGNQMRSLWLLPEAIQFHLCRFLQAAGELGGHESVR